MVLIFSHIWTNFCKGFLAWWRSLGHILISWRSLGFFVYVFVEVSLYFVGRTPHPSLVLFIIIYFISDSDKKNKLFFNIHKEKNLEPVWEYYWKWLKELTKMMCLKIFLKSLLEITQSDSSKPHLLVYIYDTLQKILLNHFF